MSLLIIGGTVIDTAALDEEADLDPTAVSTLAAHETSTNAPTNRTQTKRTIHSKDTEDKKHTNFAIPI